MIIFAIVESPYAGDVERNLAYLRAAMHDCFKRGEIPFASHALYTQPGVLNDHDPVERAQGIAAGKEVAKALGQAAATYAGVRVRHVFYTDLGESRGMIAARSWHRELVGIDKPEDRSLTGWSGKV